MVSLSSLSLSNPAEKGEGRAPVNIALVKYWGKRDQQRNLPVTGSLSLSLSLFTKTHIRLTHGADEFYLNGQILDSQHPFFLRLSRYLDPFRSAPSIGFIVHTQNDMPTAAGLASSASGFAALVKALDELFQWGLESKDLSILARLGSGSACRSIEPGFVEWLPGDTADGQDSYAVRLPYTWESLRMGILMVNTQPKAVSSREGMRHTQMTSPLYPAWPGCVAKDLHDIKSAIVRADFKDFGRILEGNALGMHSLALSARPASPYISAQTLAYLEQIWRLRSKGLEIYATLDAGPNIKVCFLDKDEERVLDAFAHIQVVAPCF